MRERQYWDDYQRAFSEMLSNTSTEWAPWYVIPADHKWFARICVSHVLANTLIELDPQYPKVTPEQQREEREAKAELLAQAPEGTAADPFGGKPVSPATKDPGEKNQEKHVKKSKRS